MITAVIQAGGRSTRMGRDKGLVKLHDRPLVEHVLQRVGQVGDEVILITNNPDPYRYLNLPIIEDPEPGLGALPGLITALAAASSDCVIVAGVDMPFVSPKIYRDLLTRLDNRVAAVVPVVAGVWQPFHAVYRPALCLSILKEQVGVGVAAVRRGVSALKPCLFEMNGDPTPFFNINTEADLALAQRTSSE